MNASATARNLVAPVLRRAYRVRVQGVHLCPRRGPLLVVAPHLGFLDSTVIATCLPRPVDVLVGPGALTTVGARVPGRIVVDADDPGPALREACERMEQGAAVGAWTGEGLTAAGYLAVRTGAAILPVAVFGGAGRHPGDPPPLRSAVDIYVGEPFSLPVAGDSEHLDPRARSTVLRAAELIRQHVADHARAAGVRAGRSDGVALTPRGGAPDNGAL